LTHGYLLAFIVSLLNCSKRGDKHFVVKIGIQRQKLYVMTAQVPEKDYQATSPELMEFVKSFRLL
jgi:hypothetical protein